jgi:hypothetical protein
LLLLSDACPVQTLVPSERRTWSDWVGLSVAVSHGTIGSTRCHSM